MFGKKKPESSNSRRPAVIVRETIDRIVIRSRRFTQFTYCASCGKVTPSLTSEQAQELMGDLSGSVERLHVSEVGSAHLLCAGNVTDLDEEHQEKEK